MTIRSVKILRAFYKEQNSEGELAITPEDEAMVIEKVLSQPNPGVLRARRKGIPYTIADGDTIYEVSPDGTRTEIGKVSRKDVKVTRRTYSVR
jgi:hypothetical protein